MDVSASGIKATIPSFSRPLAEKLDDDDAYILLTDDAQR